MPESGPGAAGSGVEGEFVEEGGGGWTDGCWGVALPWPAGAKRDGAGAVEGVGLS